MLEAGNWKLVIANFSSRLFEAARNELRYYKQYWGIEDIEGIKEEKRKRGNLRCNTAVRV